MGSKDQHNIESEPQWPPSRSRPDESERKADRTLSKHPDTPDERMRTGQSVHDEPNIFETTSDPIEQNWTCSHCGYNLRGLPAGRKCPECGEIELYKPAPVGSESYRTWLEQRHAKTRVTTGWFVALIAALIGGPLSVITTFLDPHVPIFGMGVMAMAVCLIGPIVEEVMKVGVIAWLVEQKPYLFRRREQIFAGAVGAAFLFSAIENFLYLNVYVPNPSKELILWRWTICVALHVGCTFVAARGIASVWQESMTELRKPRITRALPMLITAIAIHCTYNSLAMLLAMLKT